MLQGMQRPSQIAFLQELQHEPDNILGVHLDISCRCHLGGFQYQWDKFASRLFENPFNLQHVIAVVGRQVENL